MNMQDFINVFDLVADGVNRDEKLFGNKLITHTVENTFENFFLPVVELLLPAADASLVARVSVCFNNVPLAKKYTKYYLSRCKQNGFPYLFFLTIFL
jgi:hypothetical protein